MLGRLGTLRAVAGENHSSRWSTRQLALVTHILMSSFLDWA